MLALLSVVWLCFIYFYVQNKTLLKIVTMSGHPVCSAHIISTPSEREALKLEFIDSNCYFLLFNKPQSRPIEWLEKKTRLAVYLNTDRIILPAPEDFTAVLALPKPDENITAGSQLRLLGPVPRAIDDLPQSEVNNTLLP